MANNIEYINGVPVESRAGDDTWYGRKASVDLSTNWKIHLPTEITKHDPLVKDIVNYITQQPEVCEFKVGHGGSKVDGKGMTIYVQNFDDMKALATRLNEKFGDRLPNHIPDGDIRIAGNIGARFDAEYTISRSAEMHSKTGTGGFLDTNENVALKAVRSGEMLEKHIKRTAPRIFRDAIDQFGEKMIGKEAHDAYLASGKDMSVLPDYMKQAAQGDISQMHNIELAKQSVNVADGSMLPLKYKTVEQLYKVTLKDPKAGKEQFVGRLHDMLDANNELPKIDGKPVAKNDFSSYLESRGVNLSDVNNPKLTALADELKVYAREEARLEKLRATAPADVKAEMAAERLAKRLADQDSSRPPSVAKTIIDSDDNVQSFVTKQQPKAATDPTPTTQSINKTGADLAASEPVKAPAPQAPKASVPPPPPPPPVPEKPLTANAMIEKAVGVPMESGHKQALAAQIHTMLESEGKLPTQNGKPVPRERFADYLESQGVDFNNPDNPQLKKLTQEAGEFTKRNSAAVDWDALEKSAAADAAPKKPAGPPPPPFIKKPDVDAPAPAQAAAQDTVRRVPPPPAPRKFNGSRQHGYDMADGMSSNLTTLDGDGTPGPLSRRDMMSRDQMIREDAVAKAASSPVAEAPKQATVEVTETKSAPVAQPAEPAKPVAPASVPDAPDVAKGPTKFDTGFGKTVKGAGVGLSVYNLVQGNGDKVEKTMAAADVVINTAGAMTDLSKAAPALKDAIGSAASKANVALMAGQGIYAVVKEDGPFINADGSLGNKGERAVGETVKIGGTLAAGAAIGTAGAAAGVVVAPVVATIATGVAVASTVDASIELNRAYEKIDASNEKLRQETENRINLKLVASNAESHMRHYDRESYNKLKLNPPAREGELPTIDMADAGNRHLISEYMSKKDGEYRQTIANNQSMIADWWPIRSQAALDSISLRKTAEMNLTTYEAARKELDSLNVSSPPVYNSDAVRAEFSAEKIAARAAYAAKEAEMNAAREAEIAKAKEAKAYAEMEAKMDAAREAEINASRQKKEGATSSVSLPAGNAMNVSRTATGETPQGDLTAAKPIDDKMAAALKKAMDSSHTPSVQLDQGAPLANVAQSQQANLGR